MAEDHILSTALGEDAGELAAAEKRMLMSRLLARLAHEIRNPLSSLDIHFQLLEEDLAGLHPALKERTTDRLDIIRTEMHRLEATVKHFLRLAGTSHLELESVDLAAVCEHVRRLLQPDAEAHQVGLICTVEPELPPAMADPEHLTQVLLNLVINALQAVGRNGRIDITCRRGQADTFVLEVRDTGPGVPPDQQTIIFEPYFTTKSDGTGLGLWISQQIVAAHGGAIRVQNDPEGGARFSVHLPRRPRDSADG